MCDKIVNIFILCELNVQQTNTCEIITHDRFVIYSHKTKPFVCE